MSVEPSLPEAWQLTDRASIAAQSRFLLSTRVQLLLLVVASGIGVITWVSGDIDIAALAAGAGLVAAAAVRFLVSRTKPHRTWYEGRAAAESLKTLAWRYAVGAQPFPIESSRAQEDFQVQAREVFSDLTSVPTEARAPENVRPTSWMGELRAASLQERKSDYLRDRIEDQFDWYSSKSAWNRRRARFWSGAILVLLLIAAAGAFLKGFGVIDLDLFGVAGAVVASAAAWSETKQHSSLANAYRVAADELASIRELLGPVRDESEWSKLVGEAEAAISREHTMWKASSSKRKPAGLA
ncbi:MAG: DUF4231 domain-containing protein [Actinomycetota bacterium]